MEGPDDAVDAYGLNVYSWCDKEFPDETGKHNFEYSPYSAIRDEFKHFSIPLLFTEFGCTQGQFMTWCPYRLGARWGFSSVAPPRTSISGSAGGGPKSGVRVVGN